MARKSIIGWLDLFFIAIIILNIIDFVEFNFPELDFLKKILSWTILGMLFYRASPSHVIFGERHKGFDVLIIITYFAMIFNKLTHYAGEMAGKFAERGSMLTGLFTHLDTFGPFYDQLGLYIGVFGMVVLAALGVSWRFKERSVMGVLHEAGEPGKKTGERYFMTLLVLFGFFLLVFNLMMEWLAIAVDATLLLIALVFYSVLVVRHKVTAYQFLEKVGNVGNDFYQWFIDHFRYRETFFLGIVGLLVLHLLTDIGNFIIPYLTGLKDILYFGAMNESYAQVWAVLALHLKGLSSVAGKTGIIIIFIGNIMGFILLFISPAIIWRSVFHRRHPSIPRTLKVCFFASLPAVLLAPLFSISRIGAGTVRGIQVQVQPMLDATPPVIIITAMIIMGVAAALARGRWENHVWVAATTVFFGRYVWLYFIDLASYFQESMIFLFTHGLYVLGIVIFVFQALTIMFYVGGFILFLYELMHRTARR